MSAYWPPVAKLLNFEECKPVKVNEWIDYPDIFEFTEEHIPELLRMMQDSVLLNLDPEEGAPELPPELDPALAMCAPIHAWRALGKMKAVEAVDGMIPALESAADEWALEELPTVCQLIGPAVVEPIGALLKEHAGTETKLNGLVECLYQLPTQFPETRDRCVELLTECLTNFEQNDIGLNTIVVSGLVDLKAVEATEWMAKAYQAEAVEEFLAGTWPQVQVEMGLKTEADFTEEELKPKMPPGFANMAELIQAFQRSHLPDASTMGLPVNYSSLTSPAGFNDMLRKRSNPQPFSQKGFGGSPPPKKKKKR